jgi:biotin/methionine sulfoxide reductase
VLGSETLARLDYADCRPHPAWIEPAEWLGKPSDPGQLHLISHQPAGRLQSQLETGASSRAMKRNGREQARINPDDALALGIEDGQAVRIWNDRGADHRHRPPGRHRAAHRRLVHTGRQQRA